MSYSHINYRSVISLHTVSGVVPIVLPAALPCYSIYHDYKQATYTITHYIAVNGSCTARSLCQNGKKNLVRDMLARLATKIATQADYSHPHITTSSTDTHGHLPAVLPEHATEYAKMPPWHNPGQAIVPGSNCRYPRITTSVEAIGSSRPSSGICCFYEADGNVESRRKS